MTEREWREVPPLSKYEIEQEEKRSKLEADLEWLSTLQEEFAGKPWGKINQHEYLLLDTYCPNAEHCFDAHYLPPWGLKEVSVGTYWAKYSPPSDKSESWFTRWIKGL